MTTAPESVMRYGVNRLTIEVGSAPAEFQSRYEQAVPPFPAEQVAELVRRQAPWPDMLDLMAAASPVGFFIFYKIDVAATVRLAGDKAVGVAYLMGNNTLIESMFRHEPAILVYAPLHIVIWGAPAGPGYLTFDKPSDQFGSFGNTEVSKVGAELDDKLAALLEHLAVSVPAELRTTWPAGLLTACIRLAARRGLRGAVVGRFPGAPVTRDDLAAGACEAGCPACLRWLRPCG